MKRGSLSIGMGGSGSPALALASQAEAEAGTNNTKAMTPLRVAQAITELGGGDRARVAGALHGYASAGEPGTPAQSHIDFSSFAYWSDGNVQIWIDGLMACSLMFAPSDPAVEGTFWVTTDQPDPATMAAFFASVINANFTSVMEADHTSGNPAVIIRSKTTGSSSFVSISGAFGGVSFGTPGQGNDPSDPSGEVAEVVLHTAGTGRRLRLVRAFMRCDSNTSTEVQIAFLAPSTGVYQSLAVLAVDAGTREFLPWSSGDFDDFYASSGADAQLVARYAPYGPGVPNDGTETHIGAVLEEF